MRTIHSAALGMWLSVSGAAIGQDAFGPIPVVPAVPGRLALDTAPAMPVNQQLATAIGERLRQNTNLRHFRVDIALIDGVVELGGTITDAGQRDEVLRTVQSVPGVERVRDRMVLTQVVATAQASDVGPMLVAPGGAPPVAIGQGGMMPPEPLPIYHGTPGLPNPSLQPPPLPPYAWPTYAPYNNYSRVAMPTQYPYEQWPFIGPMYPFPKVPLGWRSVTLRWEDGHWWYSRTANGHDWWRVRYW